MLRKLKRLDNFPPGGLELNRLVANVHTMTTDQQNIIRAFSAKHVVRVTGLSNRQLSYWDKTEFFKPRYAYENRRSPYGRIYSFKDVVGLRIISILRKEHQIPLQQLRKVAREFTKYGETPWSLLAIYVFRKEVHFREPDSGRIRSVVGKQYINLELQSIAEDVANRAAQLKERSKEQIGRVVRHRHIAHNSWVIAGTRIPVAAIKRFHAAGYASTDIVREYPLLTTKDVKAALRHRVSKVA
jgi:uncharacterized protein (DUF433 family)